MAEVDSDATMENEIRYILRQKYMQGMLKVMPKSVQNKVVVLKNIQLEQLQMEAEFFEDVHKLEVKYQEKFQKLFDKRFNIINGNVEPPKTESKWKQPENLYIEGIAENLQQAVKGPKKMSEDTKGIPGFWLTIFRNTSVLCQLIQPQDEPALRKLKDITVEYKNINSFALKFHFEKNDYFSNEVVTKKYFLKSAVDPKDPFSYDGPKIYKYTVSVIEWEKDKNLTMKTIRKKQKHKQRGAIRTVIRQVPTDSFFNFFSPQLMRAGKHINDRESKEILETDFEIGHFLRSRIIPKAVLYYTGDLVDDEDDDDDEDFTGLDDDDSNNEAAPFKENQDPLLDDCRSQ